MRSASRRHAFTLVELLVVISIIALLVSIALPSLRKARKQARAVLCATHLHAQSQALEIYYNEYNGYIPREYNLPQVLPYLANRMPYAGPLALVLGYKLDSSIPLEPQFATMPEFQCPDFPHDVPSIMQKAGALYPQFANEVSDDQVIDYVSNDFQLNYDRVTAADRDDLQARIDPKGLPQMETLLAAPAPIVLMSWVRKPAQLIYLSEAHAALTSLTGVHDVFRGAQLPRGETPRVAVDMRHPAGIHAMYFDGHIERALPEKQELKDWYDPTAHAVAR